MSSPRWDPWIVAVTKAAVGCLVLATGFVAVSDDDFARLVIAQRFSAAPSFDPSGTSWLPAPFWLYGGFMTVFGRSIDVARAIAFALGIASALLLLVAARWLGASRQGGLAGALLAAILPHAAWLGVATVPEAWVSSLTVLGLASLSTTSDRHRLVGGLALLVASWSRYEAWPAAAVFVGCCALDLRRSRLRSPPYGRTDRRPSRELYIAATVGAAGPIAWLFNGALRHGDALFFLGRVAAYRDALGGETPSAVGASLTLAERLLAEPEVVGLAALLAAAALRLGRTETLRRYIRPLVGIAAMVVFLAVGELRGGAATHHAERALLSAWLLLALLAGDLGLELAAEIRRRRGVAFGALAALAVLALGSRWSRDAEPFAERDAEVDIGRRAAQRIPAGDGVSVGTHDYGFFAVMAALGRPEHSVALATRDPRDKSAADPLTSGDALAQRLAEQRSRWLIADARDFSLARGNGAQLVDRNERFVIVVLRTGSHPVDAIGSANR